MRRQGTEGGRKTVKGWGQEQELLAKLCPGDLSQGVSHFPCHIIHIFENISLNDTVYRLKYEMYST